MGRMISALLAFVGLAPPLMRIADDETIYFSMSTIADDLGPIEPVTGEVGPAELAMHEDEWRQIEFFPAGRRGEIQAMLEELARFEAANRHGAVFQRTYVRRLPDGIVLAGAGAAAALARALDAAAGPGPILLYGPGVATGRVANGFSLQLGGNVQLYGYSSAAGVMVLGANVGDGGDHSVLSRAFTQLHRSQRLVMVDWRGHLLLTGVAADGSLEIWRPD